MKILMSVAFIILASGCATQSAYGPADHNNGYGYAESRLTSNRYRVSFIGNAHTPSDRVKDYALLRAAELTLQQDYDWFNIVSRETDKETREGPEFGISANRPRYISRDCGLLRCRTTFSPVSTGAQISSSRTSTRYTSFVEIVMGSGEPTNPAAVYDASELSETLRATMGH